MFDLSEPDRLGKDSFEVHKFQQTGQYGTGYKAFKRAFDVAGSLLLLPLLGVFTLLLVLLNMGFNRGPLFFVQQRMGQHCRPFRAYKFRSMIEGPVIDRGPFDALEHHRITFLGRVLRKSRIDELPQILNVLRGEMSLIGPRPDFIDHARVYVETVPGYRERHAIRPGISGLAQVTHGYVDALAGLHNKVAADLHYIQNASIRFDLWIAWQTFLVVALRKGM